MDSTTTMNTITPTSGIDLLVHLGMERLREKTTSPARDRDSYDGALSPVSGKFPPDGEPRRSRVRSGDYSCFQSSPSSPSSSIISEQPSKLLSLPNELQYMIVSYLDFGDLERLRRTSLHYRRLLNADYVRAHLGGASALASQLASHCHACLERPGRHALILDPDGDADGVAPRRATCFACAVQARSGNLRVGTRLTLADAREAWVCRWCGWPVAGGPSSWASDQFHVRCYDAYYRVLWGFLGLGFAQFAVGVVAAALGLVYFRRDALVFPPAVASFVLLWLCMAGLAFRGNRVRTYHWVGAVELVILGLWIPPVYQAVKDLVDGAVEGEVIAALVFFVVNM
ncbi:hypothetical protein F5B20DRAFT_591479 [Whalleya microplaca]|nr:hypothetical protein F5B20DRAFT_591479 [Whalleya microplaca]